MGSREVISDGVASVVLDDSHFPLAISTWQGAPTESLVRRYFEWNQAQLDRAKSEGVLAAVVVDTLDTGRPPPTVRKVMSSLSIEIKEAAETYSLGYGYVVLSSALVRGTLTALTWINPNLGIRTESSVVGAIRRAIADLAARGMPGPSLIPDDYVRPDWDTPKTAAS